MQKIDRTVMDRSAFANTAQQAELQANGFVVADILSMAEIERLSAAANARNFKTADYYTGKLQGMNVSLFDTRKTEREIFFDEVWQILETKLKSILTDYEPVMINYWSKLPGGGHLELHQNWTHVDEEKYTSLSLWIPLQPTTRKNGTLEVVPRSHRRIGGIRGPGIGHVFQNIEQYIIAEHLKPVDLTTGQVVFIDDSIIHYTGHNNDVNPRNSIQVLLKPVEAAALLFVGDGKERENHVKRFEVEKRFFPNFELGDARTKNPDFAKLVDTFVADFPQLTVEEFNQKMSLA